MAQPSLSPRSRRPHQRRGSRRRGLAPLELVLWLPILLFVMALMMIYGTMATWRVRAEVISRDAIWRTRWPRTGANEAAPTRPYWPADARMTTAGDVTPDLLDLAEIDQPVVRGPLPNGFVVQPVLEPTQGAVQGISEVNREYPLLPRMGSYASGDVANPLLDRKWSSAAIGIPNRYRRTLVLYQLPKTSPHLPQAFRRAVDDILAMPHHSGLAVLDRDEDIRRYRGGYHDFHPRVGQMCELDPAVVHEAQVERLIDTRQPDGDIRLGEISLLPRRMTNYFLSMYRQRRQTLQNELDSVPPPSPARQNQIQAELAELEPKIEQLESYQARLPQIEDALRASAAAVIP